MGASPTKLHALRERLAKEFHDILNTKEVLLDNVGQPIRDKDGRFVEKRPSPAMYNVIRQFLKDNGIDREPLNLDTPKKDLAELPFAEPDELPSGIPAHLLEASCDSTLGSSSSS